MSVNFMDRLEETFMNYTKQYDQNIIDLIKEKEIEISIQELREILDDAKNISVK